MYGEEACYLMGGLMQAAEKNKIIHCLFKK